MGSLIDIFLMFSLEPCDLAAAHSSSQLLNTERILRHGALEFTWFKICGASCGGITVNIANPYHVPYTLS